jgi:site-specific DNA-methyltransferase (adenine-specific)
MENDLTASMVFEDIVKYVAQNGTQPSIKPTLKTDDTALYVGDCLEIMSRFPDNYVDMIFADPPYNLSNDGVTCHAGRMVKVNKGDWDKSKGFDEDLKFHETWIA